MSNDKNEIVIEGIERVILRFEYDEEAKREYVRILASDADGHTVRRITLTGRVSSLDGAIILESSDS